MSDAVFFKAVGDYVRIGGGSVGLTPVVGDALIDPKFLERARYLRSLPEVDRIWLTTNCILLDKFGIKEILQSGITAINVSTAGFDADMYLRVYRNASYQRMPLERACLGGNQCSPGLAVAITIALRPDRPLEAVLRDPDFQPILAHNPQLDYTWSFTSAGGRITRKILPASMKLRVVNSRREPCVNTYNGPIVLPDGSVMGCSCVAAMDGVSDLGIGNVLQSSLSDIWQGSEMRELRSSFNTSRLNQTCAKCDMYRDLEFYRTADGRRRAALNTTRSQGHIVKAEARAANPFTGGESSFRQVQY
jgi:radical SAM protein with 4Fe4S-binding SPASM domain